MSKMVFNTTGSKMIYDGTTYYVTDLQYNQSADKVQTTDTSTSGDGHEYVYTRVERTITVSGWTDTATADVPLRTLKACTIQFEGRKYIGSASFDSIQIGASLDAAVKFDLNGVFQGSVSSSLT